VVRYYDNMWFFYQLQSRMRELRRDVEQPQQQQQNQQQNQQQQKPSGKGGSASAGYGTPLRAQSNLGSKTTAVVVSFETGKSISLGHSETGLRRAKVERGLV
jgi:hypothetical protein